MRKIKNINNKLNKFIYFEGLYLRRGICVGCKNVMNNGKHKNFAMKWDYKTCTHTKETDAYGIITFPGSSSKNANVRVIL